MRYLYGLLTAFLFIAVLGFAIKNAEPVTLHYYLGLAWSAPLVLVVLTSFALGAAIGIVACLGLVVKQRRAVNAMKKELTSLNASHPSAPEIL